MKKIAFLFTAVSIIAFNSCKPKNESNTETISGTDSSLMTLPTTSPTGEQAKAVPDSNANPSVTGVDTVATGAVPDPAKKGKKGKVSMTINLPSVTGSAETTDNEGYYTNVYPAYPGGDNALIRFFEKNIQYPQEASDNGVEGTVKISFTVDETGKIGSPKVTSPKMGYGLEDEAMRVFNKMPTWKPGSLKGKNVKTRFTLPVRFQLES